MVKTTWGKVEGLPDLISLDDPDTYYIVSSLVLSHCDRPDVIAPDTKNPIRDSDGKIIGVTGFRRE